MSVRKCGNPVNGLEINGLERFYLWIFLKEPNGLERCQLINVYEKPNGLERIHMINGFERSQWS